MDVAGVEDHPDHLGVASQTCSNTHTTHVLRTAASNIFHPNKAFYSTISRSGLDHWILHGLQFI